MVAKPSSKKKSWQHQLITKPLAANVLGFWLVGAACTRAAGASGWLFKAAGSLDKLNKMSWCHVTMSSSEPALGKKKKKKRLALVIAERQLEFLHRLVVVWLGLLFEMRNCSDVTLKSCHGHVCEKNLWCFSCWENQLSCSYAILIQPTPLCVQPYAFLQSLCPCFGADVSLKFRMFQTVWQPRQTDFIFSQYRFCWSHRTLSNKELDFGTFLGFKS